MRRRLLSSAIAGVIGLSLSGGCGQDRPPVSDDFFQAPDGSPFGFSTDGGGQDCNQALVDGGPCGCLEISLLTDQPNLYFVLDRSGSMLDSNKWQTTRQVVADVVEQIGPRAKFGVAVFPDPASASCSAGKQVMPMRVGDSPAGTAGPTTHLVIATTNVSAEGGTPTAATLTALQPSLQALGGRTFVILATDGGPNCDLAASCDATGCIPNIEDGEGCPPGGPPNCCTGSAGAELNCLDGTATLDAVTALKAANIPVYVIGIPGSAPYANLLDQMATAGGTARASEPLYYSVDTTDSTALEDALAQVAAKITATCTFPLSPAPPDPTLLNIYFDNVVVPKDPENGWSYDGSTVTLTGTACNEVLSGKVLNLRVIAGCPTVVPR
ncbi:MAG: vWA domain-containing protein [Polyangiaceae bacterium]